jgi:hypothetical protein
MKTLSAVPSQSESLVDTAIVGLCVFSVANPLLAQLVYFAFPRTIAGMNIMQWFQGLCFPVALILLAKLPKGGTEFSRFFSRLLWVFVVALGLLHLRIVAAGRLPADMASTERLAYFKVIFALVFWYCTSCLIQSCASARRLLHFILLGALISAGWILICYASGLGGANYAEAGVTATSGSEGVSGKAMAGFLLPAAAGAMFLALREDSCRWAMGVSLLLAAVFVTFDRSAQVAFLAAFSWMGIWWVGLARPRPRSKTVVACVGILVVLGGAYLAYHGTQELLARWTTDFDRGEVGSGRGSFYTTAWTWFWRDSSLTDFLLGMGFGNIYDLMYTASGIYRHTHSDFFDMLLIGGVVGLGLYVLLFGTVASLVRGLPAGSVEFAALGAILVSFGVMSLLTGLMTFPHTAYAFGAQCICIRALARGPETDPVPLFAACPGGFAGSEFYWRPSRRGKDSFVRPPCGEPWN